MSSVAQQSPRCASAKPIRPTTICAYTLTTALGHGREAHWEALREERSGLRPQTFDTCSLSTYVGQVERLEHALRGSLSAWDCRNNRLAQLALEQDDFIPSVETVVARYGRRRVGVFLGTSTAGIHQTELAYRQRRHEGGNALPAWFDHRRTQNMFSVADFVRTALRLEGPAATLSTACSSSAKVFASAYRAMASGYCDAAVVGGVDSLCLTTLQGFNSLQLISAEVCRPADSRRNGLSIGEGAGFALLERARSPAPADICLLGYGESSDAYHMSTPDPQGQGAAAAMQAALDAAGLQPQDIDYINLHGTATPANDLAEDRAISTVFGPEVPLSSTKGWTGHTLGAAGIVEAAIAMMCVQQGFLPRSLNTREKDPALAGNVLLASRRAAVRHVLSNSFGFGGNNCSLIFGRAP